MNRMTAIINMYWHHALVRICLFGVALTMVMIKIAAVFSSSINMWIVEDLLLVWYLSLLTLGFMLGIIIKRQITSFQSQLLPGYRIIHIVLAAGLWTAIAMITAGWLNSLPVIREVALQKPPLAALAILTFLTTIIVAYFSIRYLLITVYVLALYAFAHVMDIHDMIVHVPVGYPLLIGLMVILLGLFITRLFLLREGGLEYSYLFAWPLYRCQEGELFSGTKRSFISRYIEPYYQANGLLKKISHWRIIENDGRKTLVVFLLLAVGVFELYVFNFSRESSFYVRPYENFLLLAMVPFFMSLCFNYRVLAYSGYARMLPIKKEDLFLQWGALLSYSTLASWFLCIVVFALVPALLLNLTFLMTTKFWVYLLFSGVFSQVTLFWFIYVASLKRSPVAITHCLCYLMLVLIIFLNTALLSTIEFIVLLIITTAMGINFSVKAYRQWCRREVEN